MQKIRNVSGGPRGITAGGETVMLEPGEERELDVQAGDLKAAQASGWFAIGAQAPKEPETAPVPTDNPATTTPPAVADRFDGMSDADLRAFVKERDGNTPGPNTKRDALLAKARE